MQICVNYMGAYAIMNPQSPEKIWLPYKMYQLILTIYVTIGKVPCPAICDFCSLLTY